MYKKCIINVYLQSAMLLLQSHKDKISQIELHLSRR